MKKLLCRFILLGIVAFIWYGLVTDCPDTAGYVYCPKELR